MRHVFGVYAIEVGSALKLVAAASSTTIARAS